MKANFKNVDEYISNFPEAIQTKLQEIRKVIQKNAPDAVEYIGYQMPAYKTTKALVYFAGYKKHIGFYPTSSGIKAFEDKLDGYKTSKGAVQFPLDEPLPLKLIGDIVKFRVKENLL